MMKFKHYETEEISGVLDGIITPEDDDSEDRTSVSTMKTVESMVAVVIADAGCGKSTLIWKLAASLHKEKYILLYLFDSKITPRWFYKGCLDQLGLETGLLRGRCQKAASKGNRSHPWNPA